jgi:hypothetical protein
MFFRGVFIVRSKIIGYGWGLLLLSGCQIGMGPPSYIPEKALPSVAVATTSPAALKPPVRKPSSNLIPAPLQPVPLATPAVTENEPIPKSSSSAGSGSVVSGVLSGSGSSGGSASTIEPGFYISDVVLAETGESIMGAESPAVLSSAYADVSPVLITLKGHFKTEPALTEPLMRFTYEPGLLHQTFTGEAPGARILLDDSLLLEPVNVSLKEIQVALSPQFLTDLQHSGLHTLRLIAAGVEATQQIRIMGQDAAADLLPVVIETAVQNGAEQSQWLRIEGHHYFINPSANRVWWKDQELPVRSVEILSTGQSILWARLPLDAEVQTDDQLIISTPFGVKIEGIK